MNIFSRILTREKNHTSPGSRPSAGDSSHNGKRVNLDAVVNENPMGCTMTNMLEFAEIHFQLSMKYSTAVLNRNAFVPK